MIPAAILAFVKGLASPVLKALADWRVLAVIAAVLALLWGLHETRRADGAEQARKAALAALEAAQKASAAKDRQASASASVDQHSQAEINQIHQTTTDNLKTVKAYVSPVADSKCIIGVGAVQLLDATARGVTLPAAPSGLPDADSGVGLSDILQADITNAGSYRQAVAKGDAWDEWYDAQNPEWRKAHPLP